MRKQLKMQFEKETPGAIRYTEPAKADGDPHYLLGTLYLRKRYVQQENGGRIPLEIVVTISDEESS